MNCPHAGSIPSNGMPPLIAERHPLAPTPTPTPSRSASFQREHRAGGLRARVAPHATPHAAPAGLATLSAASSSPRSRCCCPPATPTSSCWPRVRSSSSAAGRSARRPTTRDVADLERNGVGPGGACRMHPDSFAGGLRHALLLGYCFSMLYPELGPSTQRRRCTRRWTLRGMLRALYAGLMVAGLSLQAAMSLYREMTAESLWDSSVDMMFFGSATAAALLFLELGPRWRRLTIAFECIESRMCDFGYPKLLGKKMKKITAIVMAGAAVEHILSVWSVVDYMWPCYVKSGAGGLLKGYAILKFPMSLSATTYEHWRAIVLLLLNFVATFFWNFNHLFVMLISMPLSYRFRQINDRLEAVAGKVMSDSFWRRARETYNELSVLSRLVDEAVGKLVLLSFASNMYFICRQLLHSFRTLRTGFLYNAYFLYSFGFMLARTVLVSLFAAAVHDQSRRPLPVLFSVPAEGYTPEVERFLSQVTRDHVALTGCRFFSVTRGLILTVAGTIISYEIVLMQLHPPTTTGSQHRMEYKELCQ